MQIPEMKEFGAVLKSSPVVELTEAETEYVVSVVKHIFKEHIVLQYEIKNTLPDTVLENVTVAVTPSDEDELEELFFVGAPRLDTDVPGKIYVAFQKVNGEGALPTTTFSNTLKFTSKEIDPTTGEPEEGGYDDEYEVSEFELSGSDYVVPAFAGNFAHIWEQVGAQGEEAEETLQLSSMKSIAGTYSMLGIKVTRHTNVVYRGYRTTSQGAIIAAARRHRRTSESDDAYNEAFGQDGQWRKGGGQCPDGLLIKDWCNDQDHGEKRGGGRCGVGYWVCCLITITEFRQALALMLFCCCGEKNVERRGNRYIFSHLHSPAIWEWSSRSMARFRVPVKPPKIGCRSIRYGCRSLQHEVGSFGKVGPG